MNQAQERTAIESTYFENGPIRVTNARFIVSGHTYAIRSVTSVRATRIIPSRLGPVTVILLGLPIFLVSIIPPFVGVGTVFGLSLFIGGILWWKSQRTKFAIILTTSSGEVRAWESADGSYASDLLSALNDAIVG